MLAEKENHQFSPKLSTVCPVKDCQENHLN